MHRTANASDVDDSRRPQLRLGSLWDKSTGGGDVAARPNSGTDVYWPRAPRPAGVEETIDWFRLRVEQDSSPIMLFLVGGPGAGKSHAVSELVRDFESIESPADGLAHRYYFYKTFVRSLTLVNDATIRSRQFPVAPLTQDITLTVADGSHLIACVNRGVLVEEVAQTTQLLTEDSVPGSLLVSWLQKGGPVGEVSLSGWKVTPSTQGHGSYVRSAELSNHELRFSAQVAVVYLDACSLLEKRPITAQTSGETFPGSGPYEVSFFSERAQLEPLSLPAGALLTQVVERIGDVSAQTELPSDLDPIMANLQSLAKPVLQSGFLSILRAAEIASGQRLTYREIWGAIVRAIVGDLTDHYQPHELSKILQAEAGADDTDPVRLFRSMQKLANRRFTQSIFGSSAGAEKDPVVRLLQEVDPLRDALPGESPHSPINGWASPISAALTGPVALRSPIAMLEDNLDGSDYFRQALTEFDRNLDVAFQSVMDCDDLTDGDRSSFIAWYGRYLTRLYSVSNGISGFVREIEAWTQAWRYAPELPRGEHINLNESMRTLLRPARTPEASGSQTLIPVLESRTEPILGITPRPRLALSVERVDFKTEVWGDSISLLMQTGDSPVGSVELDFILIREALSCAGMHAGITEQASTAVPRLERLRATQLIPKEGFVPRYCIVDNNTELTFTVKPKDLP